MKVLIAVCAALAVSPSLASERYSLPETEALSVHSEKTGGDYAIYVSAPAKSTGEAGLPAVYMLDADYSFAIVQSVVRHFIERGNLPPMVLVGIATAGGAEDRDAYKLGRTRDYTPTFVATGGYGAEYQKVSGGAARFADFIETELAPMIEERYGAAKDDRTIIGHSFGGLFAAYALVARPEIFQRYLLVSPSLWYDDRLIFRLEEEQAKSGAPLSERVFLSVGAFEQRQMSDDLTALKDALSAHHGDAVKVDIKIFEDETHNSVFPAAVTRGILKVFDAFPAFAPPPAPQTPN